MWFRDILQCPDCGSELTGAAVLKCSSCSFEGTTGRDFRPQKPRTTKLSHNYSRSFNPSSLLRDLQTIPPPITYDGPLSGRDPRELFSALQANMPEGGKLLDLGCGPRDQFEPAKYLGYEYVGVDYTSAAADILVDAHILPFQNNSFDGIISYAVFEHLSDPFLAINEVARVLKPGGVFVGTISQGEPFHDSYFHHTAWGMCSLFNTVDEFTILRLWPAIGTLTSLARMGSYSKVLKLLLLLIDRINDNAPWLSPRKMKWPVKELEIDKLNKSGSIGFVALKNQGVG